MTLEAYYRHEGEAIDYTPSSALTGGQVIQLADGRAAVAITDMAAGAKGAVGVVGVYRLEKTTSMVILDGGRVYWDHSANKAHYKKVNDRDFYVGRAVGDASSSGRACSGRPSLIRVAARTSTGSVTLAGSPCQGRW